MNRIQNCAECEKWIPHGEIMFAVYWAVDHPNAVNVNFICKDCMQNELREGIVPGGRI
jgi:hypothetical protein